MARTSLYSMSRLTLLQKASTTLISRRTFSSSARCTINPLANLSLFSGSKEAQYLSKERKIPRVEFHPYLELIRSSEVDPFAPAPGTSPTVISALNKAKNGRADMQTAYSLAVTNLIQHLEASKQEARHAQAAFNGLYVKYKTTERQAFVAMIMVVTLSAILLLQPDFIYDLLGQVDGTASQLKGFDWQWLGNPPSHRTSNPEKTYGVKIPSLSQMTPFEPAEVVSDKAVQTEPQRTQSVVDIQAQPSFLSRWFWKAS